MTEPSLPSKLQLGMIDQVLSQYNAKRENFPQFLSNSVQNINFYIKSDQGPYLVRFYSPHISLPKILREHRVLRWAQEHHLPVKVPLPSRKSEVLHEIDGQKISVLPWAEGHTLIRGQINLLEAAALGRMQGTLHAHLKFYTDSELPTGGTGSSWNTEETLTILLKIEEALQQESLPQAENDLFKKGLEEQKKMLQSGMARPVSDFASLSRQPVHGDYHEGNVIFDSENRVAAVLDWEMVGQLPPVFELVRTLSYVRLLEPALLSAYLSGYRKWVRFTQEECVLGIEMWFQSLLHATWEYERRFLDKDKRTERFFPYVRARLVQFANVEFREQLAQSLVQAFHR